MKQYLMIKCLNCGHLFKSAVDTERTRCSKCGKSKLIQVSATEESVISDMELLKKRVNVIENIIKNNMQTPGVAEPIRTHTPKPELKAEVNPEPKSTSTPYTTSQDSTPGIEVIRMDEEEIIEVFSILKERIEALESENKELKEMIVSNNERHESMESEISDAIKNHGGWIQIFKEMFSTISGRYDMKNRVINILKSDDPYWTHWNRHKDSEIIHDISKNPHQK